MKIDRITITGADDKVSQDLLVELSEKYPFVEWGILFSKDRIGHQRFPSTEYINELVTKKLNLSAHFCGWWAKQVLEAKNYELIDGLPDSFKRIQLNYNFKHSEGFDLENLVEYMKTSNKSVILQYNKSNSSILDKLAQDDLPENIHFLYDSSGGRGTQIQEIGTPIRNQYTGYSGGLDDKNIDDILAKILIENINVMSWADLESGARTNDEFDLIKVDTILYKSRMFIATS